MKKLKIVIIVMIIILLIIACILLPFFLNNAKEIIQREEADKELGEYYSEIRHLSYFETIEDCIQKFYDSLNKSSYYFEGKDEDLNKEVNDIVINLLSDNYIKENNITTNNLNNFIKLLDQREKIEILDIKSSSGKRTDTFAVYGIAVDEDYKLTEEFYLYVYLDQENKTFAIEPIKQNIDDFSKFNIVAKDEEIVRKGRNKFEIVSNTTEQKVTKYINKYKILSLEKPEVMYEHIDEKYKATHFGSLDNFKIFINQNREEIKSLVVSESKLNFYEEYYQYEIKDQYGTKYTFNEKTVMDWSMKLDTYKLVSEEEIEEYKKMTNKEKVEKNIKTFFDMLNSKDYSVAYSHLSDGFKSNYFKTETSFETYMRQNLYNNNKIKLVNFSDEISGVFTEHVEINDGSVKNSTMKRMNIIMQLQNETDFVLSFEIL